MADTDKKHVIWADDDANLSRMMTDSFKMMCEQASLDVVVDVVPNGSELVAGVRRNGYCLAITDYRMPIMTGIDAIKAIRSENPVIPVYLISMDDHLGKASKEAGATGYFLKENFFVEVPDLIERHLVSGLRHNYMTELLAKLTKKP
jgi:CheY-like chemotaxis protein